jgi:hypothetical protein
MDALVFGEDKLTGFIPKMSINMTTMVVVLSCLGGKIRHYSKLNLVKVNGTQNS